MGWQIIIDQESQTALLVDPAGPWALGPCLVGPGAADTLSAFVEGLDQDPAELTTWELAATWQQFLALMGSIEDDDRVEVAEATSDPDVAPDDVSGGPLPSQAPAPVADVTQHQEAVIEHQWAAEEPPGPVPNCPNCNAQRWVETDAGEECGVCGTPRP